MDPALLIPFAFCAALLLGYIAYRLRRGSLSGIEMAVVVLVLLMFGSVANLLFAARTDFPVALMSGLLIAGSAMFGLVFNEAVAQQTETRRRAEKRADMRRALWAEISDYVLVLETAEGRRKPESVAQAFASEENYLPFVVSPRKERVFSAALEQIEVLDTPQIMRVVRFYALLERTIEVAQGMMTPRYADLSDKRRMALLNSLMDMENTLQAYGLDAMASLGDADAGQRLDALSNKGLSRSDREAGA